MAAGYGFDISVPAANAREAVPVALLRLPRRGERAERRRDVTGPALRHSSILLPRDLAAGPLNEEQAQEIIDDFVIKLRIVRFLRTPGSTTISSREIRRGSPNRLRYGRWTGRLWLPKTSFRYLHTLYNLGPAPEPNLTIWYSPRLPDGFRSFATKVAIDTSSIQFESDEIMRRAWGDDGAVACCVSPMLMGKQMQFFGARANLAKCLLYAINGGRDEMTGQADRPGEWSGAG
jgi:formate C-acetyltransferase